MARSTKWADNEIETLKKEMMEWAAENDGVLSDEHLAKLNSLEGMKDRVVEETIIEYKSLVAKQEMFKAQIKGLKEQMDAIGDESTKLAKTIGFMLDGKKYQSATSLVKYNKSKKTVYSEAIEASLKRNEMPLGYEEYCEVTEVVKMPKKALTEAIKAGEKFGDIRIVESNNISIK